MTDNVPVDKPAWRAILTARRAQLSAEQIATARRAVADTVLRAADEAQWRRIAAYEPLRREPGSTELLSALRARGVDVVVPVVLSDRDLDWVRWGDDQPRLGVDAIATVDAVLVPALAATSEGIRLGRGGGSYDRALQRVSAGTPVIALLYAEELVDDLPQDPWDRPVTAVATPIGWHQLG